MSRGNHNYSEKGKNDYSTTATKKAFIKSEQADAALREQLRPIYQEYNGKKYTVAVFQSGTEDLYEQTHQLLLYNRNRAAELEAKQQAPVME